MTVKKGKQPVNPITPVKKVDINAAIKQTTIDGVIVRQVIIQPRKLRIAK